MQWGGGGRSLDPRVAEVKRWLSTTKVMGRVKAEVRKVQLTQNCSSGQFSTVFLEMK